MVLDASLYPIKFTFNTKLFNSKFLISKLPSSFVETPATGLVPSKTLTVEKLTGSFVVLSIIFPETTPGFDSCAIKFVATNSNTMLKILINFIRFFFDY